MGSKVHFRVRIGSKFALDPSLLVNLPEEVSLKDAGHRGLEESKELVEEESKSASKSAAAHAMLNGGSGDTVVGPSRSQKSSDKDTVISQIKGAKKAYTMT